MSDFDRWLTGHQRPRPPETPAQARMALDERFVFELDQLEQGWWPAVLAKQPRKSDWLAWTIRAVQLKAEGKD